ncbi:SCO3242 family prenyltransferase [Streptomyces sp. NPDC054863]
MKIPREASGRFAWRPLVRLVRAPAALSVPGDILCGAAAAGRPADLRTLGAAASSVCLYWAGMALNDYADAAVDGVERPGRPVPSGAVERRTALAAATGLTAAGLALAAACGRRRLVTATALTAAVWAYDLRLKDTVAGPATMAAARGIDVLMGGGVRAAAPAAAVALHTYGVTTLSRHEVSGGGRGAARAALACAAGAALTAGTLAASTAHASRPRLFLPLAGALLARYASGYGRPLTTLAAPWSAPRRDDVPRSAPRDEASRAATRQDTAPRPVAPPDDEAPAERVAHAVQAGILALIPLQAALAAACGAPLSAALVAAADPLASRLVKAVPAT